MNMPNCWTLPTIVFIALLITQSYGMDYKEEINIQELETLFGEEDCIEGTLSVSGMVGVNLNSILFTEPAKQSYEKESSENIEEKSPMSMLHELAFFNNIKYGYILSEEKGPAHDKLFTITLNLGEETYSTKGSSIKKAQHSTAKLALQLTSYKQPPIKSTAKQKNRASKKCNSIGNLENFVSKHWNDSVIYSYREQSSRSLNNFYQDNMFSKLDLHKVTVAVGKHEFVGEGSTLDIAKQKAARNALQELNNVNGFCLLEETFGNLMYKFFNLYDKNYSPISFVHKFASKSKLKISFEIVKEEGPSHLKLFTYKCSIGEQFVSFGKGNSKTNAKKEAALNMIEKLQTHAYDNGIKCGNIFKNKTKKKKSIKLVKSVSFHPEMKPHYSLPKDIDPVSKLLQIQRENYDILPIFTLLQEKGETVKEFLIEVKVGNIVAVGSGPNKKTAKRKAAEQMLEILGYSRGSEEFRGSFSEQNKKDFSNKLVTSSKRLLSSGLQFNSDSLSRMAQDKGSEYMNSPGKLEINKKVESTSSLNHKPVKKIKKNHLKINYKAPKTLLDSISRQLRFRYQFSNFPKSKNGGFVSLLSLTTDPPKVCYGSGLTADISQDKAAEAALKELHTSHVDDLYNILESSSASYSEDSFNFIEKIVEEDFITQF